MSLLLIFNRTGIVPCEEFIFQVTGWGSYSLYIVGTMDFYIDKITNVENNQPWYSLSAKQKSLIYVN